jgi:hypothetical protein
MERVRRWHCSKSPLLPTRILLRLARSGRRAAAGGSRTRLSQTRATWQGSARSPGMVKPGETRTRWPWCSANTAYLAISRRV